jgi:hypothetical protein
MTILEKRRSKVERLTQQALKDRMPHKYMQGRFILNEIEKRQLANESFRQTFLTQIQK